MLDYPARASMYIATAGKSDLFLACYLQPTYFLNSRITIIGTGLLGASLGLALRRASPTAEITGVDRPSVLERAKARGAITHAETDLAKGVSDAEIVVVATPLNAIPDVFRTMGPFLAEGALVTDLCSLKRPVLVESQISLPAHVRFLGGHPMAGSEKTGPDHADELLFENATWVLCPLDHTPAEDLETSFAELLGMIRATGARIMLLPADQHDHIAAAISHLPQLLAIALTTVAGDVGREAPETPLLAAGGFRDLTRIASSEYDMWRYVLSQNADELVQMLDRMMVHLQAIRDHVADGADEKLRALFEEAALIREKVPSRNKGFLQPISDVFVFVRDQPGAIHTMTGALTEAGINIKDIELLKIREGTGGTFRIGLDSDRDAASAEKILKSTGFETRRLSIED